MREKILNLAVVSVLLLGGFVAGGCSGGGQNRQAWVERHGGLAEASWSARIEQAPAAARLAASVDVPITFNVLASDELCAYSWPDGQLFVSCGVLKNLDDDELAAVIAHELGHLLSDGHATSVVSLRGEHAPLDPEQRADAVGVELLVAQGVPGDAMQTMLNKVMISAGSDSCRSAIARRITTLRDLAQLRSASLRSAASR